MILESLKIRLSEVSFLRYSAQYDTITLRGSMIFHLGARTI